VESVHPWGFNSPIAAKFTHRGKSSPIGKLGTIEMDKLWQQKITRATRAYMLTLLGFFDKILRTQS
jgi:hypothetical protein